LLNSDLEKVVVARFSPPTFKSTSSVGVEGSGSRVEGSGFRIHGSGFRVQGSGFRAQGAGFRD
jgi:hypothetical protein